VASKTEAKQRAGEILRLTAIGQSLESQNDTRMGEAYDEVYARLEILGLTSWDTDEEMPDEVTPNFLWLMAHNKMDLIGVSTELRNRIISHTGIDGEAAIREIRGLVRSTYASQSEPEDF